ncbi:MAG: hypothetical protein HZB91_12085 [Elusimicrobia bacterium]|nr:hypothetical protein [Elusimicrobiota bacterium]
MTILLYLAIAVGVAHAHARNQSIPEAQPEGTWSKQQIIERRGLANSGLSNPPVFLELEYAAPLSFNEDRDLFVAIHRGNTTSGHFAVYRRLNERTDDNGFPRFRLLAELPGQAGGWYSKPDLFSFRSHRILHVTHHEGSRVRDHYDYFWRITHSADSAEFVNFIRATTDYQGRLNKDEIIRKDEDSYFSDGCMAFRFSIWKQDDRDCCPSGGEVTGTYDVVPDSVSPAGIKIAANSFDRHPIPGFSTARALCPREETKP